MYLMHVTNHAFTRLLLCKSKNALWSFGKHNRKSISDHDIVMKLGPDVTNSPAKARKKN